MNQMIVFLETPLFSHILLDLSREPPNLLSRILLSDCLYGDCGILSHEKKVVKLFSAAFPKYYICTRQKVTHA